MAWNRLTNNNTPLALGDNVRVTVTFARVPFTAPSDSEVVEKLNDGGLWLTHAVEQAFLDPGRWTLEGEIRKEGVTVGEIIAHVQNALNFWYTFTVEVQSVEIGVGFRPGDLVPDTKLTIALSAIAIIFVVGYIAVRGAAS